MSKDDIIEPTDDSKGKWMTLEELLLELQTKE